MTMAYSFGGTVFLWLSAAGFLLAMLMPLAGRRMRGPLRWHWRTKECCLYAIMFAAGGMLMLADMMRMDTRPQQGERLFEAVATDAPERHGRTWLVDARVLSVEGYDGSGFQARLSILSSDSLHAPVEIGDGIVGAASFTKPRQLSGGFNWQRYLYSKGIRAQALLREGRWQRKTIASDSLPVAVAGRCLLNRLRGAMVGRYSELGMRTDNLAVVAALTLGDKSMLTKRVKDYYSVSGASHILALSGLHLGIIYMILTTLLARYKRERRMAVIVMLTVWGYVVLAGLPVSAVRSAVMLSLCSLSTAVGRCRLSVNRLAVAAAVVLCLSPVAIADVGFQMSFLCVLSIILIYEPLYRSLPDWWLRRRPVGWAWGMVCMSVSAQVVVAPLTAYHFGIISCYFLITNFIAIPAAMLLLWGGVLLLVTSVVEPLQAAVAFCMDVVAGVLNGALRLIASLPGGGITVGQMRPLTVFLIYAFLLSAYLLFRKLTARSLPHPINAPYPDV